MEIMFLITRPDVPKQVVHTIEMVERLVPEYANRACPDNLDNFHSPQTGIWVEPVIVVNEED